MGTFTVDSLSVPLNQSLANPSTLKAEAGLKTLQQAAIDAQDDKVRVSMDQVYKSLTAMANEVLRKLQEVLGDSLPEGVYALKPEDHTSEKTAQRIVDGVTALFSVYARQNKDLEGEELISNFMKTIRGGISQGYSEAEAILGDVGAFEIDGVKGGIDETKKLVEEKLQAFEKQYRESLVPTKEAESIVA